MRIWRREYAWISSSGRPIVGFGSVAAFEFLAGSGWRMRAMVGGGDTVRVLKRAIRSRVAGSLVGESSFGVRSRKRW